MEEPAEKRGKQTYGRVQEPVRVPGTYHMKDTLDNQPRTNLRRGLRQKAVTTRDRCVAHMLLRSCRDVRRPRHLPNAKLTAIVQSHPDGTTKTKYRTTLFRRPPDRGGILKSSQKQTKQSCIFSYFVRTRYIILRYVQKSNPKTPASSLFNLTWGGV